MKRLSFLAAACLMAATLSAQAVSSVWGVNPTATGAELVKIDPFTGAVLGTLAAPVGSINANSTEIGLAGWGQNALYFANSSVNQARVYVINPLDGTLTTSFNVSGGWEIDGLGFWKDPATPSSDGYLYTSGCSVDDMHRYIAANGSGPAFYWSNVSDPRSVAGDYGGRIFTYAQVGATWGIWEVQPLSDVNATFFAASPSTGIVGMAYDGQYLYLSDTSNMLYVMNNAGALVSSRNLGYNLYALASTEGTGDVVPTPDGGVTFLLLGLAIAGLSRAKAVLR